MERRLKWIVFVSGILLLLTIVSVSALQLTSTPQFCSSCHEMSPEYATWQSSSHSQIACVQCHIEPGTVNFVVHKVKSFEQIYRHVTKSYLLPMEAAKPISNEVCEQCHNMSTRIVTPGGDLKVPHTVHLDQGIMCVDCHGGVAHANITERQETIDGDFSRWTEALGKAQMVPKFTGLDMQQCIDCHNLKKVPVACETCHTKIVEPDNHRDSGWVNKGKHGAAALTGIESCDACHSNANTDRNIQGLDKVTAYARTNTFCRDCHQKLPASHQTDWRVNHAENAAGTMRQGCLVCHSEAPAKPAAFVPAKTYCQLCHKSQHAGFNPKNHPITLPADPKPSKQCVTCHNVNLCITCHDIPGMKNP